MSVDLSDIASHIEFILALIVAMPSVSRKLAYPTWADVRAADKIAREHAEKGRRDREGIFVVKNGDHIKEGWK